eukprot:SAG31_NODE_42081_length_273_cov_0.597701_1_plen_41_part_01
MLLSNTPDRAKFGGARRLIQELGRDERLTVELDTQFPAMAY